jgi:hypothetical protein
MCNTDQNYNKIQILGFCGTNQMAQIWETLFLREFGQDHTKSMQNHGTQNVGK